ncbi:MAG: HD domain-containing phosphohydrolase [Methylococcaceae bacterium]
MNQQDIISQLEKLTDIGIALSVEKNTAQLLEKILIGAKSITNADGGTIYRINADTIQIEILHSDSLGIYLHSEDKQPLDMPNIPLYINGSANLNNVVSCSYHKDKTINIHDAYEVGEFDFSGTKAFDAKNNYHSKSFLAVPLKDYRNETIGILQLINALDSDNKTIIDFDTVAQRLAEALASQAAIVLTKQQLIADLENMFDSLVKLIATAIDEKSPYTGGHCRRVPELTMMLAEAAHNTDHGYLKDFQLSDADRYELTIAGWLHDCGKITTPEFVVDKATKLETIFDRIHLLEARFEILKRDAEIALLKQQLAMSQCELTKTGKELPNYCAVQQNYAQTIAQLNEDFAFIKRSNTGSEFISQTDVQRLQAMQNIRWLKNGVDLPLLSDNELYNLSISRGTLTAEERKIINNHIVATISMLETIKFPKHLQRVPEYAGGHHERIDGKGYPKGLKREEMSIPARAMAIADIFEALTAKDRPYKAGKKLSEALAILAKFKDDQHIDPDLYDAFIEQKIYMKYASIFLDDFQIDID